MVRLATLGLLAALIWSWPPAGARNDNRVCATGAPPLAPPPLRTSVIEINRTLARLLHANADLLVSGASWTRPVRIDGTRGAFVYDVQPDSLLDVFGFRNGDFVEWRGWRGDVIRFRVYRSGGPLDIVLRVNET